MIRIIADSTCDLSEELLKRYDVAILPLHIHLGDREYADGVDLTPEELFRWSDENQTTPKTSAPSPEEAMELFSAKTQEGEELICFSISDFMSASGNVMRIAAKELGKEDLIHVVDSASLSTGAGLLVIAAAEMAREGKTAQEIIRELEQMKPRVRASFVVDTLTYLHRGGRCSSVAAMAGSMLKLHPRISVKDGKMEAQKKYRGKMSTVILSYAKDMEPELLKAEKDRVFITHSGCDEEIVQSVKAYLESLGVFREILITRAGSVVSSHCGPGTLGVLFIAG
ncbi:MAG: DegV family protein [Eubacteriales bacterium]|nr:DegV family protein [Eubacteriales bacterium]